MKRNVAITPAMIRAQSGEGAKLLSRLSKLDRNSKEARKVRRQLRKLGIKLSEGERKKKAVKWLFDERYKILKREGKLPKGRKRPKGERLDQVLDTAQTLVEKVGYRSKPQLIKRLMEIYPRLMEERAAKVSDVALDRAIGKNPRIYKKGSDRVFNYKRYRFIIHSDNTVSVVNPGGGVSHHLSLALALSQRGFSLRELRKHGIDPWKENPLRKMSLRDAAESVINAYLEKKPTREEYSYWIEAWMDGLISKKELVRKVKGLLLGRKGATPPSLRSNPLVGATPIYDKVLAIEAQKGGKSQFRGEQFRHDFKDKTQAEIFGLPDGSVLIKSKGKKRLWKKFNY